MDHVKVKSFTLDQRDGVAILDVTLHEINSPEMAREFGSDLEAILQIRPADKVLIDFEKTKYMSSTAFAVVIGFVKRAAEAGLSVAISGWIPAVRFGADIIGVGRLVPVVDTRKEGVAVLAG